MIRLGSLRVFELLIALALQIEFLLPVTRKVYVGIGFFAKLKLFIITAISAVGLSLY